ncbi:TetR/AcrR family transcriptional regulator [Sediminispirochaeta smaragdinae]|nr:TetR/AcrR family transcriptional regulator [Sediminispirochaeta smaragdinae]
MTLLENRETILTKRKITDNIVIDNNVISYRSFVMSSRDTSLDLKIIQSAKKEFLEKGFIFSSLRKICRNAGVTTGAVYKRYDGKEVLFANVVKPALNIFESILNGTLELNKERTETNASHKNRIDYFDKAKNWIEEIYFERARQWIKEIYKEQDAVKILLTKADGTAYSNFVHDFIEQSMKGVYLLMTDLENRGLCKIKLSKNEFHVLFITHWTPFFEMFINDFTVDEAIAFLPKITDFLGWDKFIEY